MSWSFSSLKDFENCARRYHETRVLNNYPREQNEASIYGTNLHEAAEMYTKGVPLPLQFEFVQPVLDVLLQKSGNKYAEHKMALTVALEPCSWNAKNVWVRGIADLLIVDQDNHTAWCVDYKTGNPKYANKDQLDLLSLLVFATFPDVVQVNSALIFVVKDIFVKHKRFLTEIETLWWEYRQRLAKLENARSSNVWTPTQSGLCRKHCQVTTCEFNGRA